MTSLHQLHNNVPRSDIHVKNELSDLVGLSDHDLVVIAVSICPHASNVAEARSRPGIEPEHDPVIGSCVPNSGLQLSIINLIDVVEEDQAGGFKQDGF